ncbi:uncharacterized protein LOC131318382 [Rhododendron vialii]|uniref:uncharacterized protein LOC131318382 n=1 Tax=Rhododendron vialii TaxID=182163 RepID=UPI00265EF78B|nr:uncharacterized protein LOC131318382 [Rhododendron vialii]XP_058204071.1 uncharacterized protein LOC131318382 [Rhododendron vialii]
MKCLINEVDDSGDKWRADNGFKCSFFNHLEKELEKVLPGSNLKANPHIDSKIKHWKQTWAKIVDIIALSGFGWYDVNKSISVENDIWDEYEKAHPKNAKGLYEKSFLYFDDWQMIFEKDRAMGEGVEDLTEMAWPNTVNETLTPPNDFYVPHFGEEYGGFSSQILMSPTTPRTPLPQTFTPHSSLPTSTPRASTPQDNARAKKGRKRTRMGDDEVSMVASMQNWMNVSERHTEKMANSFGYEKELSARHTQVQDELSKLDITLAEKFKLSAVICQEEQRVDNFYGTKPEEKQAYVEAILSGLMYGPI